MFRSTLLRRWAIVAVAVAPFFAAYATPAPPADPAPAPTATPSPAAAPQTDAEIIRNGQGSLVFVEGHAGSGSGFVCTMGNGKFLFTNAHVLAGNIPVTLTLLDGSPLRVGAAAAAVGHDLVCFAVAPTQSAFRPLEHANDSMIVGDDVLVLGNAQGARVINPISGKIVGLGPNLVEVDAPFQPGNSGSPIIQKKTGRVIGIATYVTEQRDDREPTPTPRPRSSGRPGASPTGESTPPPGRKLRRFGYRLDSVKNWQDIAWPEFQAEAAAIKGVDERTEDILALIHSVNEHKGVVPSGQSHTPPVERLLQTFFEAIKGRPSPTDELRARQNLLDDLQRLCQSDLAEVRPKLRYDYFVREAHERQEFRDQLSKNFGDALRAQTNSTGR